MNQKSGKTSLLVYLLAMLGTIMLIFFLTNMFPPYPSYPFRCVEMGGRYVTFYQNLIFFFASIVLLVAAVLQSEKDKKMGRQDLQKQDTSERMAEDAKVEAGGNGALEILENLLERDELTVMKIVIENDGITQDSLHFRTGFSQPKISMIIKKLEEKNLIVRERFGKTYRIYLSEWLKGLLGKS